MTTPEVELKRLGSEYAEKYGFRDPEQYVFKARMGLDREVVEQISWIKNEPEWMREFRLKALEYFLRRPMPTYESEVVYHSLREDLERQGVIFTDTDSALREYPDLVKQYFGTVVPPNDNKFAALNSAVWSGGSFIYVPEGVHGSTSRSRPTSGSTPRTWGSSSGPSSSSSRAAYVHYVEGCSAPIYTTDSLHSAVVEIIVKRRRALSGTRRSRTGRRTSTTSSPSGPRPIEDATMEWIDGNIGSKVTMKYPSDLPAGARGPAGRSSRWRSPPMASTRTPGGRCDPRRRPTPRRRSSPASRSRRELAVGPGTEGWSEGGAAARATRGRWCVCDALMLDEQSSRLGYVPLRGGGGGARSQLGHEATVSQDRRGSALLPA
jgi:Fe-S cluster assembly protein SufB